MTTQKFLVWMRFMFIMLVAAILMLVLWLANGQFFSRQGGSIVIQDDPAQYQVDFPSSIGWVPSPQHTTASVNLPGSLL